jgi:hypothetical protein
MTTMRNLLAAVLVLFAACSAQAQLSIEITGAGAQRIPIALAPLAGEGALLDASGASISALVRADLERSGLFRGVEVPRLVPQPTEASTVSYAEWRSRLADALVLGSVAARPDGRYEVRFRLYDVLKQSALGGVAYTLTREQVRATAHRIADYVYEKHGASRRGGRANSEAAISSSSRSSIRPCLARHCSLPSCQAVAGLAQRPFPERSSSIVWSEQASSMQSSPHASGWLTRYSSPVRNSIRVSGSATVMIAPRCTQNVPRRTSENELYPATSVGPRPEARSRQAIANSVQPPDACNCRISIASRVRQSRAHERIVP